MACRETGQALDGRDLGKDWPETWHKILRTDQNADDIERPPTPPAGPADQDDPDPTWDRLHLQAWEIEADLPVQSPPSFGACYRFLLWRS